MFIKINMKKSHKQIDNIKNSVAIFTRFLKNISIIK